MESEYDHNCKKIKTELNKTIFITGASSGIGEACAERFAADGDRLILAARRKDKLEDTGKKLQSKYGIEILFIELDVRDREAVKSAVVNLPEKWRNIDILINNAGLASGLSHFYEGDYDDWDRMIDTNVKGLLNMSREISPLMIRNQNGHIINIGSIAGKEVYDKGNVYVATKHAVDALNKAMRLELSPFNVRVSAVHPGAVETEFSIVRFKGDEARAKQVYAGFENLVAADIADAVHWIATRPLHVNINELTIMPTAQPMAGVINRK